MVEVPPDASGFISAARNAAEAMRAVDAVLGKPVKPKVAKAACPAVSPLPGIPSGHCIYCTAALLKNPLTLDDGSQCHAACHRLPPTARTVLRRESWLAGQAGAQTAGPK